MRFCDVKPFESEEEHRNYCDMLGENFEQGTVGFKMSDDYGNLGVCQLYLISNDAYVLSIRSDGEEDALDFLASGLNVIVSFFKTQEIRQISFPIKSTFEADVAEEAGFEAISDTMYVYVFDSFKEKDELWNIENSNDMGA